MRQPKNSLPLGPYIVAVSVVSPFIRFKNASKETIDASDELVEELRRALMQTGQRLSRYLKREHKAGELEERVQHIEQFGPILVETLARILSASDERKKRAEEGLAKLLERDTKGVKKELDEAEGRLASYLEDKKERLSGFFGAIDAEETQKRAAKKKAAIAAAVEAGELPPQSVEVEGDDEEGSGKKRKGKGKAKPTDEELEQAGAVEEIAEEKAEKAAKKKPKKGKGND